MGFQQAEAGEVGDLPAAVALLAQSLDALLEFGLVLVPEQGGQGQPQTVGGKLGDSALDGGPLGAGDVEDDLVETVPVVRLEALQHLGLIGHQRPAFRAVAGREGHWREPL